MKSMNKEFFFLLPLFSIPTIPILAFQNEYLTLFPAITVFVILTLLLFYLAKKVILNSQNSGDMIADALQTMSSSVMYAFLDEKGHFQQVSDAFCERIGFSKDDLLYRHCSVLYNDQCSQNRQSPLEILGEDQSAQMQLCSKNGAGKMKWFSTSLHRLNSENEFLVLCQEIINSPMLEERKEMLERQSRYASMGEMISMIAHQWRQPLSTIAAVAGNVKISLKLGTVTDEKMVEAMSQINRYALYLSDTITDFRNFFKPQKDIVDISTSELVKSALKFTTHIGKSFGISIVNECSETSHAKIPRNEMIQVIINLIKNAQDVLVHRDIANRKITIRDFVINNNIILEIADNAGGIDQKIADKIFDPYFTTKEDEGTGLGLYMSRRIVEEHMNGTLQAYNSDEGAVFSISIPISEGEQDSVNMKEGILNVS